MIRIFVDNLLLGVFAILLILHAVSKVSGFKLLSSILIVPTGIVFLFLLILFGMRFIA